MSDTYVGWDGKRYPWPPPEGWYHASDGRWWAPGTGPNPPEAADTPRPAVPPHPHERADAGRTRGVDPQDDNTAQMTTDIAANGPATQPAPSTPSGPSSADEPLTAGEPQNVEHDHGDLARTDRRRGSGDRAPTDRRRGSGEAGRSEGSPRDQRPGRGGREGVQQGERAQQGPAVPARLLILGAVGAAVLIGALAYIVIAGNDPETTSTEPIGGETTSTAATDETTPSSTATTLAAIERQRRIGQFRLTLTENGLVNENLTDDDILSFGESFCGLAESSVGVEEFEDIRIGTIATSSSDLDDDQLSLVIDAAVITFCPTEADRLGIRR